MGSHRRGPIALTTARVVPDVASFSVDDGFLYAVPEGMDLQVGSMVRVPLGGRRVRGWVVNLGEPIRPRLKEVLSRSGDLPVFDRDLLGVLRWAAAHYVAPVAALLGKATPPNLPRSTVLPGPATTVAGRHRPRLMVGTGDWAEVIAAEVAPVLAEARSVVVVAPTVAEAETLAEGLQGVLGEPVPSVWSGRSGKEVTALWVALATGAAGMVVGTRDIAAWPMASPGAVVVHGEGRRGMKDKGTPTVHARDLVLKRAAVQRFPVVMTGHVPTAEALTAAGSVTRVGRPWGLVEVVDRAADPPGTGLFASATAAALRASGDRRVLLFTHRRSVAQRCVRCRELRRCPECGAAPGTGLACNRCGATVDACSGCGGRRFETLGAPVSRLLSEAGRIVPRNEIGEVGSGKRVVVGTERDLPGLRVDLTVVVDGDGPLMAPSYRAAEEGVRMLGRAVAAAGSGRGRRAIVQSMDPTAAAMRALQSADPVGFVRADAERRSSLGFPPGGEILVLEATGLGEGARDELVVAIGGRAEIHGPAATSRGQRWLLQGRDLRAAKTVLRGVVGRWRDGGATVRVDADPVDL